MANAILNFHFVFLEPFPKKYEWSSRKATIPSNPGRQQLLCVNKLLEAGADFNLVDEEGQTALCIAARWGVWKDQRQISGLGRAMETASSSCWKLARFQTSATRAVELHSTGLPSITMCSVPGFSRREELKIWCVCFELFEAHPEYLTRSHRGAKLHWQ